MIGSGLDPKKQEQGLGPKHKQSPKLSFKTKRTGTVSNLINCMRLNHLNGWKGLFNELC